MKKLFFCMMLVLLSPAVRAAEAVASEPSNVKMGQVSGLDQARSRAFDKRLYSLKGSWGIGFQGTWLGVKGSDSNVMALLTGLDGGISFGRIAPAVTYSYADNLAVGLRLTYIGASGKLDGGALQLMDLANFDLAGKGFKLRSWGASLFHRCWYGIDDRGRFAVYFDGALSYLNSFTEVGDLSRSQRVALSISPGFEAFVMNFVSLNLSVGLLSFSYDWTNRFNREGERSGGSHGVHLGTGLSLLDLNFGLSFYF